MPLKHRPQSSRSSKLAKKDWQPLPSFVLPLFFALLVITILVRLSPDQQRRLLVNSFLQNNTVPTPVPDPTITPVPTQFIFSGVGIRLGNFQAERLVVKQVISGSPAELAGIKPDDLIVKIDGAAATGDINQEVEKIRGPEGSSVTLTIERNNKKFPVTIVRQQLVDTLPPACY